MKYTGRIPVHDICRHYGIQEQFVHSLFEYELIHLIREEETEYLPEEELRSLERYMRLHKELNINTEGIDAINRLLRQIEILQDEVEHLRKRIAILSGGSF